MEGKKKKEERKRRIMPSLVATTSTPARKPFVRTHYVRTNNAKFSGHYVYPRTETVRAHALRSHQYVQGIIKNLTFIFGSKLLGGRGGEKVWTKDILSFIFCMEDLPYSVQIYTNMVDRRIHQTFICKVKLLSCHYLPG